jgi:cytidyltransferase-like protein
VVEPLGSIIGLRPQDTQRYIALHANPFPGVLQRLSRSGIRNYSIFLHDGVLFSHLEYVGAHYAADMAAIADDETTRQWWLLTDPMQTPLPERQAGERWAALPLEYARASSEVRTPTRRHALVVARPSDVPRWEETPLASAPEIALARAFPARERIFIYLETTAAFDPAWFADELQRALPHAGPVQRMGQVFHTDGLEPVRSTRTRVFVSGCFDMLHSGHVAFLKEAATHGDVYVGIGSDATIHALKGRHTVNSQDERRYMIEALACVTTCVVNTGGGVLDFEHELRAIQPDIFLVNDDGDSPAKRALCDQHGIAYVVLARAPAPGLPERSTTALRSSCLIPFRIDLAGGWLDQPFVSMLHAGPVLTVSIEPTSDFNERSGMASSTRKKAIELWRTRIPHGDLEHLAKTLFSFENPPGTKEVAGSQDALGLVLPGLNRLFYDGRYWPSTIDRVMDDAVLRWIESHLQLVTLGPRISSFNVLDDTRIDAQGAKRLADAAEACWAAMLARDLPAFGRALRESFDAQVAMFPLMVDQGILDVIDRHRDHAYGWKLSGAGGGGYLILVSDTPVDGAITIRIRRHAHEE